MNIKQLNLVKALQLGIIDWFQYLEKCRELEPEDNIPVEVILTHSLG